MAKWNSVQINFSYETRVFIATIKNVSFLISMECWK